MENNEGFRHRLTLYRAFGPENACFMEARMKRLRQCVLIASCLPLCWLAMMAVHELGHCLVAWGTGGRVTKVVLHPLAISRTDVSPNPSPWAVAWGGPLLGSLLPLILFAICRVARNPAAFLARFFTGFCFVTNGVYIFAGAFARVGDAEVLRREGAPLWGWFSSEPLRRPPDWCCGIAKAFISDSANGTARCCLLYTSM